MDFNKYKSFQVTSIDGEDVKLTNKKAYDKR